MIREIQGKIRKIRARFEDSKEIPGAVDVIPNRVEPLGICPLIIIYSCTVDMGAKIADFGSARILDKPGGGTCMLD